jgi:hypothetical protein
MDIVQGEDIQVKVRVTDKVTGRPYNFEGFEGATASFYQTDSDDPVAVTGTNPETNLLQFDLSPEQSELLEAGDSLDFEYRWEQDGELYIERVEGQITVLEQLF